jgi:hypothetical protein
MQPPAQRQNLDNPVQQKNLSNNDILSQLDIWRSIDSQFNNINRMVIEDYHFIDDWPARIKTNRGQYVSEVTNAMHTWDSIMRAFLDMPRSDAFRTEIDAVGAQGRRQQTYLAFYRLSEVVAALPAQLPDDYENIIRPYVNGLKTELDTDRAWMEKTQNMSASKKAGLSNMLSK